MYISGISFFKNCFFFVKTRKRFPSYTKLLILVPTFKQTNILLIDIRAQFQKGEQKKTGQIVFVILPSFFIL